MVAAVDIIIISNIVQPISCITFNTAGIYEPLIPKDGLILTKEGTALSLPTFPAIASSTEPAMDPIKIANIASVKVASVRNDPADKTSKPTPRLDHNIKKSFPLNNLLSFGTGSIPECIEFL